MKRIFVLTVIFLSLSTACNKNTISNLSSQSSDSSVYTSSQASSSSNVPGSYIIGKEYPLDTEYIKALKNSGGSNVEFCNITVEYADKWEEEMKKYYNILYNGLNNEGKELLKSSQRDWGKFINSQEKLDQNIVTRFGSGTIVPLILSENRITKFRSRAVELFIRCQQMGLVSSDMSSEQSAG